MPHRKTKDEDPSAVDSLDQLELQLRELRTELEHAQRLATLGTLAAGIAHEINNILTPVLAYAQLAKSHPNDADLLRKAIDTTITGVETASQITRAMLGFAGTSEENVQANVSEVIQSALVCLARDPSKDRIKISISSQAECLVAIRPLALQQVLMNLILNACSAMKGIAKSNSRSGAAEIGKLEIKAIERTDGTTQITVADTGPGLPVEVAGKLFRPFSRNSRSHPKHSVGTNATYGGTGLGLSICRRLIEEAGGQISASSSPGRGTTFTIILPTCQFRRSKAG